MEGKILKTVNGLPHLEKSKTTKKIKFCIANVMHKTFQPKACHPNIICENNYHWPRITKSILFTATSTKVKSLSHLFKCVMLEVSDVLLWQSRFVISHLEAFVRVGK